MGSYERKALYLVIVGLVVLLIAKHYSMKYEQELSVACQAQTGYVEHKKIGRNWYCKSSGARKEEHWKKLRRH